LRKALLIFLQIVASNKELPEVPFLPSFPGIVEGVAIDLTEAS
jgi:hypothetical protein